MGYRARSKDDSILTAELIPQINQDIEHMRQEVSNQIANKQQKSKQQFDKHRKVPKLYKNGDLVLIMRNKTGDGHIKKIAPKYAGPMIVKEVLPNDRYRVADMPGTTRNNFAKYENVVAVNRMKPWLSQGESDSD